MNESYNGSLVPAKYDLAFEGRTVTAYMHRGRLVWVAAGVGAALDYADEGRDLSDHIRRKWSEELVEGVDFVVLTGEELREFRELLDVTVKKTVSRAPSLMVLYESGLDLVCLKTEKPLGKKLRRMIAEEVLPKLRRGEAIQPSAARPDPVHRMDVAARYLALVQTGLEAIPEAAREARAAVWANALALATGAPVTPLLPSLPAGEWKRPSEIAAELGVTANAVGRAITALGLRGNAEHCKTIMDEKKGSAGQVACYLYNAHAVEQIRGHLAEKGKAAA